MGELVDQSLLDDAAEELTRAEAYAASQRAQQAARRTRGAALRGSAAAKADLDRRWAAVNRTAPDPDALAREQRTT